MSLDYTCYALGRRPSSPRTISAAASGWHFVFVDADNARPLHRARALPPYCLAWGSRLTAALDLGALIRADDRDRLAALQRRDLAGCCELEIESDFEVDPELLAELPPRQRRILAEAKIRYGTRTSAGQSGQSWRLQIAVCQAIARVAGGLLEEPQAGTYRAVSPPGKP